MGVGARPLCEVQTRACAPLPAMFCLQIQAEWASETTRPVSVHEGCAWESVPGAPVGRKGITGAREPLAAAGERHRSLTAGEAVARQSHLAVFPADPRRRIYAPRGVELTAARAVSMRRAVARGGCHPGLRHTGQCDTPRGGGGHPDWGSPSQPPSFAPLREEAHTVLSSGGLAHPHVVPAGPTRADPTRAPGGQLSPSVLAHMCEVDCRRAVGLGCPRG